LSGYTLGKALFGASLARRRLARGFRSSLWRLFGFRRCCAGLFRYSSCGTVGAGLCGRLTGPSTAENAAQLVGHILVDRARVSLLLGNAQLGEFVQQFVSLDFQFPGQDVNTNLVHN
jgi:hypothetical protein